jgi:ribulose-bisphosphate carboxylase large chain
MTNERIVASYWIETAFPLESAAASMAGEQSTGTFIRVPGETDAMREAHAARVEDIVDLGTVDAPSLPGSGLPKSGKLERHAARITLSWPIANLGPSLPNLLATVAGNLSELKAFSGLKLVDIKLPPVFLERYQGPQFGVAGTRRLAGVFDRPMIGTIIKPSVGLSPDATASLVAKLVEAGVDFIKDDELQADGPHCPFKERISAVMRVIRDHAERTGKKVMFAANLTGDNSTNHSDIVWLRVRNHADQ